MATTSPDSVYFLTGTQPQSLENYSATLASSVQGALALRERYSFVWADATEQGSQTGMVTGSTGYRTDIKTEYIYENSAWRLKTPHAEFTSTITANDGVWTSLGGLNMDSGLSTSTVFATSLGNNGGLVITDPGIYSISTFTTANGATANVTTVQMSSALNPNTTSARIIRGPFVNGDDTASIGLPNLRVASSGYTVYFNILNNTGASRQMVNRIRITRIG